MTGLVFRLQLTGWYRDKRLFVSLALIMAVLIAVSAWATASDIKQLTAQVAASDSARAQWNDQGDANPHGMAHFGDYAFRPAGPLARLDPGVQARLGKVLFLEGHRQGVPLHSDATRAGSVARNARLDPAFLLQILVPLVLIFVGSVGLAADRQSGRLKLALIQGGSGRAVLAGHFLSLWFLGLAMLATVIATSLLASAILGASAVPPGRLGLYVSSHAMYFAVVAAAIVVVTAWLHSDRGALLALLGFWVVAVVLLPNATAGVANTMHPLPSQDAFQATLRAARETGPDGHNPQDAELERLKQQMLDKHGVENVEDLPLNFDGLAMQVDEEFGNSVWDRHYGELRSTLNRQSAFAAGIALLNPYQAIDRISMTAAGTDLSHDIAFQQQAENYRRTLIEALNREHAYGGSKSGDWSWEAPAAFYATLPVFQFRPPSLTDALRSQGLAWTGLMLWTLLLLVAIGRVASRLERGLSPC